MRSGNAPPNEPLLTSGVSYGTAQDRDYITKEHNVGQANNVKLQAQDGVGQTNATNIIQTGSSRHLIYFLTFLNVCTNSLQQQTSSSLFPYVVSKFSAHSLIPAISITSDILSGMLRLPTAKMIDIWGRPQGFAVMTALVTLGLILMSVCERLETYAVARILHCVGLNGSAYILDVIIADTSCFKNRALTLALAHAPNIIIPFAGPAVAQWFLQHSSWQAAFASFALLTPIMASSIYAALRKNATEAKSSDLHKGAKTDQTWAEKLAHFAIEFDAIGVVLLSTGLTLVLLPFSVAGLGGSKWSSPSIIFTVIHGILLTVVFVLYECKCAHKSFLPISLMLRDNVMSSFVLSATLLITYFCWDGYYTSYLQVVHQLSVSEAGYVDNVYTVCSTLWQIFVGWLIEETDCFRWLALVAVPIQLLGGIAMTIFRRPDALIANIVVCQVLIAIGGGTLGIVGQVAAMAFAEDEKATLMALLGLSATVGAGFGYSVSGAIWGNTVYVELLKLLPDDAKHMAKEIYENLDLQLSYPVGTAVREAIILAYDAAQKRMVIGGMAIFLVAIPTIIVWEDVRVSQV